MTKYPQELNEKLVAQMLAPEGIAAEARARERGVPAGVLRRSRRLEALAAIWNMTQDEAPAWRHHAGGSSLDIYRTRRDHHGDGFGFVAGGHS